MEPKLDKKEIKYNFPQNINYESWGEILTIDGEKIIKIDDSSYF